MLASLRSGGVSLGTDAGTAGEGDGFREVELLLSWRKGSDQGSPQILRELSNFMCKILEGG